MPRVLSQDPEAVKKREKRNAAKAHQEATIPTTESGPPGSTDVAPEGLEAEKAALTPREKKLVKNLTQIYSGVGMVVAGIRLLPGKIIMGSAAARAEEVVRFARHHKDVMEFLEKLAESNDTFNMIAGHFAMIFAILVSVDRITLGPKSAALLDGLGYGDVVKLKLQEAGVPDDSEAVAA